MSDQRSPLAEIHTLAPERPVVNIDDQPFEMRLFSEFGAVEHANLVRDNTEYQELRTKAKRSRADDKRLEQLLDRLFDLAFVDPKALRESLGDRLSGYWKNQMLEVFTTAPLLMAAMAQADKEPEKAGESSITES